MRKLLSVLYVAMHVDDTQSYPDDNTKFSSKESTDDHQIFRLTLKSSLIFLNFFVLKFLNDGYVLMTKYSSSDILFYHLAISVFWWPSKYLLISKTSWRRLQRNNFLSSKMSSRTLPNTFSQEFWILCNWFWRLAVSRLYILSMEICKNWLWRCQ